MLCDNIGNILQTKMRKL